jgi:hypothetical protein
MSFRDLVPLLDATTFEYLNDGLATWSPGPALPVPIIIDQPDEIVDEGQSSFVVSTIIIQVQKSDISSPSTNDIVVLGSRNFRILAQPQLDELGTVWRCEATAISP